MNQNFGILMESLMADVAGVKFVVSPATAAPLVSELTAGGAEFDVTISLMTGDDILCDWFNDNVKLGITDNDDTGTATIVPAAGNAPMVGGQLKVKVSMDEAVWTAGKKATLTVTRPDASAHPVLTNISAATFVATVTADP